MRHTILLFIFFLMAVLTARGQIKVDESSKLSGKMFGDFYWTAQNHNSDFNGDNGFWARRIYLTYDREISDFFSSRLRLEMKSPGDFIADSKLKPVVKDAFLKWHKNNQTVYTGISPTPSFGFTEDTWGYRSLEKSPLDLYKLASSRDFGIAVKGVLGSEDRISYHFMFGNGNSSSSEINKGKKAMLALGYEIVPGLIIQAYGDYEYEQDSRYTYTLQGAFGYKNDEFTLGGLYAHQFRNKTINFGDVNFDVASVYAHIKAAKKATIVFRADHLFNPNPYGGSIDYIPMSSSSESTFLIGGVDLELHTDIHLMPNIEAIVYGKSPSGRPDSDIIPRLTLSYTF